MIHGRDDNVSLTMADRDPDRLVEKDFWEQDYYWAGLSPPVRPDPDLPLTAR